MLLLLLLPLLLVGDKSDAARNKLPRRSGVLPLVADEDTAAADAAEDVSCYRFEEHRPQTKTPQERQ